MLHTGSFEAIGVRNQVTVVDENALPIAVAIARAELAALDLACSRFRDDSELANLDGLTGRPVKVSPLLVAALEVALEVAEHTEGLVDPTVGAGMRAIGYDRDFAVVVRAGGTAAFQLVPASGWRSVQLDREAGAVSLRPGTELDLGATAKAFAADRIAAAIDRATGSPVLVCLGGDIAVRGTPPEAWTVRVTDDHRQPGADGQTIAIRGGGLATSSTTVRRWCARQVEMHHILDPRTGAPALEHWRTVSVAAQTCVDANAAATAAIVHGDRAIPWLESRGVAARLVRLDGSVATTGGWPLSEDSQEHPTDLQGTPGLMGSQTMRSFRWRRQMTSSTHERGAAGT